MVANALKFTFENNGDVITAEEVLAKKFLRLSGRSGFGIAPTTNTTRRGAKYGSRHRNSRREQRVIDMPVAIFGAARQEIENNMRRFARLLQDDTTAPRLVATYPDGKRVYSEIHYDSGADPQWGTDTNGSTYAKWMTAFIAPNPYWVNEEPVLYNLKAGAEVKFFLPNLSELVLSSSQILGEFTVENPGDVPSQPVWVLKGPIGTFSATLPDGSQFGVGATTTYPAGIPAGKTVTIDTVNGPITDETGADMYDMITNAPIFFAIPKDTTKIVIAATGTNTDSLVTMYFNPMQELVF